MANHQQLGSKKGSSGGWGGAAVIKMACSRIRRRGKKYNKEKEIKAPMLYKILFSKVF